MPRRKAAPKRKLHYRIGLHPVFLLVLCSVGVVLLFATIKVFADPQYTVQATVEADPVMVPAVITRPTQDYRTSTPDIDVSGTCAIYSYVKLYINASLHGAAVCDANGQFVITTSLNAGRNVLTPQIFNLTDQAGPVGQTVVVHYDVPTSTSSAGQTNGTTTRPTTAPDTLSATQADIMTSIPPAGTQLEFFCDCIYQARYVDDSIQIPVSMKGGVAPYDWLIDWGDGTTESYPGRPATTIISHTYKPFSASLKAFTIKAEVTDAAGTKATYQLYQLVRNTAFQPAAISPVLPERSNLWLALLPAFAIVTLLVFVFWLGERHEIDLAKTQKRRGRPPRHRHS